MAQARLSGDVGERAVAVVMKKIARRLAVPNFGIEAAAVDEEDVEPAVVVVVEERDSAAHFLEQELLVGRTPRHVQGLGQTGRCGHVREDAPRSASTLGRKPTGLGEAGIGCGDERGPEKLQELAARCSAAGPVTHAPAPAAWACLALRCDA